MARALSNDLRQRVLAASAGGMSARSAARGSGSTRSKTPSQSSRRFCGRAERFVDALWNTVGDIDKLFEPLECANDFSAAGYDPD
jgi:hypothetical protein